MLELQQRPYWLLLEMCLGFTFPVLLLIAGTIFLPFSLAAVADGNLLALSLLALVVGGYAGIYGLTIVVRFAFSDTLQYPLPLTRANWCLAFGLAALLAGAGMFSDGFRSLSAVPLFAILPSITTLRILYLLNRCPQTKLREAH